eukprot:6194909-Pleurochrysis_carterae.AAC.1
MKSVHIQLGRQCVWKRSKGNALFASRGSRGVWQVDVCGMIQREDAKFTLERTRCCAAIASFLSRQLDSFALRQATRSAQQLLRTPELHEHYESCSACHRLAAVRPWGEVAVQWLRRAMRRLVSRTATPSSLRAARA